MKIEKMRKICFVISNIIFVPFILFMLYVASTDPMEGLGGGFGVAMFIGSLPLVAVWVPLLAVIKKTEEKDTLVWLTISMTFLQLIILYLGNGLIRF